MTTFDGHSFDIRSLANFRPAKYLCERCMRLTRNITDFDGIFDEDQFYQEHSDGQPKDADEVRHVGCKGCKLTYVFADEPKAATTSRIQRLQHHRLQRFMHNHLEMFKLSLQFEDVIKHARLLADAASTIQPARDRKPARPSLLGLFQAFSRAQKFIHFSTYTISIPLIFALKLASQKVAVRGIVSAVDVKTVLSELTNYSEEAPNCQIKVYRRDTTWEEVPHQKIIIIDGLLAFKGSTNLTVSAWRKVLQNRDTLVVCHTNYKG